MKNRWENYFFHRFFVENRKKKHSGLLIQPFLNESACREIGACVALPTETNAPKAMKKTGRTTRTYPQNPFYKRLSARCASAAMIPALLQAPAFFSCNKIPEALTAPRNLHIAWTSPAAPEAVDLFFFDTLGIQRLDSYQQLNGIDEGAIYALSGSGAKRVVALSAQAGSDNKWLDIATFGNLSKHRFSLERENPDRPLLAAQAIAEDGASREISLSLQTMLSAVRIRTVACDFSGKPYESESFVNTRIFLSYAASEYLPLEGRATSWINLGDADSTALRQLPFPEMLLQEGCGTVGRTPQAIDRQFYCYANAGQTGTMPGTRIVLEGCVAGKPCCYPIELPPLEAGKCYETDIRLTRMGTPSPDIPTASGQVLLETRILPWDERADYRVIF